MCFSVAFYVYAVCANRPKGADSVQAFCFARGFLFVCCVGGSQECVSPLQPWLCPSTHEAPGVCFSVLLRELRRKAAQLGTDVPEHTF